MDADGHVELVSLRSDGALILWDVFEGTSSTLITFPGVARGQLSVADFDGDGGLEVLLAAADVARVIEVDGTTL